ncbi:MAG: hypothetical protein FWE44_01915 [Defluviitaleaceae bacterium]|nr:hypothetical protein [Defluviitaleaceae bacterium]
MELINSQIDKIEDMVERVYEVIEAARGVVFTSKVSVDKDSLFSIMDDIRGVIYEMRRGLPSEISQAKRVLSDKDAHLSDARTKAEMIIKAAQTEADRRLNDHEITTEARKLAQEIVNDAKTEADDWRQETVRYIGEKLEELDNFLQNTIEKHANKMHEIEDFYTEILSEVQDNRNSMQIDE